MIFTHEDYRLTDLGSGPHAYAQFILLRYSPISHFILFFETEDQHDSAKAQEAFDHLACFPLSREEISQPRIELPTYDWGEPVATQNMIYSV